MPAEGLGWWQFVPAEDAASSAETIRREAALGRGALSRALRSARARHGTARAAALLRAAEADGRFGLPLTLLLVTAQQPRALEDALILGFAIAGFAVDIRAIEGVAALAAALSAEEAAFFADAVLVLVSLAQGSAAGEGEQTTVAGLVEALARRAQAPVVVARLATGGPAFRETQDAGSITVLEIGIGDAAVIDPRFAATFGNILTATAADRLADAAAGFAARRKGLAPKLVLTDLDATFWDGVLGESDAAPIRRGYAEALAELRRRGLVLGIASRNDPGDVAARFQAADDWPLKLDDFAAVAVGWRHKAALVGEALGAVGFAPEHALFIDDDPVNCAKVAAHFPGMDVRRFTGPELAAELLADPLLAGGVTGAERGEQYRRKAEVDRLRAGSADPAAFLAALRTAVTVLPLGPDLLPRAAELAVRVNQFLFTPFRPSVAQLAARPTGLDFLARLDDAFGAHGLVGLVLASERGDDCVLDNLFLSCRALERGVEGAMLHALGRRAKARGLRRIVGRIDALPRNDSARDCLLRYGFGRSGDGWVLELDAGSPLDFPPQGVTMQFAEGLS